MHLRQRARCLRAVVQRTDGHDSFEAVRGETEPLGIFELEPGFNAQAPRHFARRVAGVEEAGLGQIDPNVFAPGQQQATQGHTIGALTAAYFEDVSMCCSDPLQNGARHGSLA